MFFFVPWMHCVKGLLCAVIVNGSLLFWKTSGMLEVDLWAHGTILKCALGDI